MQQLSDKIDNNEIAKVTYECDQCREEFVAILTRVSETELEITGAVVGVRKSIQDFKDRYVFRCPKCYENDQNFGTECDIYSRVVGFYRPVKYWNKGKQAEYKERVVYDMPKED